MNLYNALPLVFCRSGETGRRARLKILWGLPPVWVRFPPPAPASKPREAACRKRPPAQAAMKASGSRTVVVLISACVLGVGAPCRAPQFESGWELLVLGVAQDAGIPQLGCEQELCRSIRAGKRRPERVASLGLVNRSRAVSYLFDATPDMVSQLGTLNGGRPPSAVFLTHGHIGHYTGLMYLGRESLDVKGVPVYGTERMAAFL